MKRTTTILRVLAAVMVAFTASLSATAQVIKWTDVTRIQSGKFTKVGEGPDLSGYQKITGDAPAAKQMISASRNLPKATDGTPAFTEPITSMDMVKYPFRAPIAGKVPYAWATQLRGMYENNSLLRYDLADPLVSDTLFTTNYPLGQNGFQLVGDTLYSSFIDFQQTPFGLAFAAVITRLNINTWKGFLGQINSADFATVSFAQANNGKLYGEFYNSGFTGYQIGRMDLSTLTREIFGPAEQAYVAMGITSNNRLYAIGIDGVLYELSTTNGKATEVGPTGVKVRNANGTYYAQGGDIDKNTNTFYWAAVDSTGHSAVYTVDLQTGHATHFADVPNNAELVGFFIPRTVKEEAPATPADLSVVFDGLTLNGTLSFTAPEKTVNGESLTGDLKYYVISEDDTLATGTTTAGTVTKANITATSKGFHVYRVNVANNAGTSDDATVRVWAGADQPNIATNVKLTIDADGTTHLSWDAPTTTVNGGNLTPLTYRVARFAKGKETVVANSISELTFSEKLKDEGYTSYYYNVYAINGDAVSDAAESNHVLFGTTAEVPYFEDFEDAAGFEAYTVLDNNKDNVTWSYSKPNRRSNGNNGSAQSPYATNSKTDANDDWLLTPAIHLDPTKIYTISFQTNGVTTGSNFSILDVKIGTGDDPTAYTQTLLQNYRVIATNRNKAGYVTHTFEFQPVADGEYRLAFHDITPKINGGWAMRIDDISVQLLSDISAPDSAKNVVVNAGAKGALNSSIMFNVPSTNIDGTPRASVDSVIVEKDGVKFNKFEAQNAGALLSCTDNDVAQGNHTYKITAWADRKPGRPVSKTIFVGLDKPSTPNVTLIDNGSSIGVKWPTILGQNNGYVDLDNTTVTLYNIKDRSFKDTQAASFTASQNSGSIAVNVDEGYPQSLLRYIVDASNGSGTSTSDYTSYIIKGKPYDLPYKESFAGGSNEHHFYIYDLTRESGATGGYIASYAAMPIDGDGACMIMPGELKGDACTINLGKINMRGATSPMGYVYVGNTIANNPLVLYFMVQLPDGTVDTVSTIKPADFNKLNAYYQIPLDLRKYAGQRYIELIFQGYMTADKVSNASADYCLIDNFNVFDQLDKNLAAQTVSGPEFLHAGSKGEFTASIRNLGKSAVSNYKVVSIVDGVPVDTVEVNENLLVALNNNVTLPLPIDITKKDSVSFQAKVIYDGDLDEDDDLSDIGWVKIRNNAKPTPTGLTAQSEPNTVKLNWIAPDTTGFVKVTEDFESYEPFTTEFGEWKTFNNDDGFWPSFNSSMTYPGQATRNSFMIWRPDSVLHGIPIDMTPHSGKQFATISLRVEDPYDDGEVRIEGNQMLITPELSGREQTLSFWVRNSVWKQDNETTDYEEYYVPYYSTKTNDPHDFEPFGPSQAVKGGNWQEITYDVPEGTKYFCLWWNTEDGYFFMVDDVTYESVYGGSTSPLTGYNIYRDGVLVGHVDTNGNGTFTDTGVDEGSHTYTVTATYADGAESDYSNAATVTVVTGIDAVENSTKAPVYNVYTVDGKAVMIKGLNLDKMQKGVYIINNKKVVVK